MMVFKRLQKWRASCKETALQHKMGLGRDDSPPGQTLKGIKEHIIGKKGLHVGQQGTRGGCSKCWSKGPGKVEQAALREERNYKKASRVSLMKLKSKKRGQDVTKESESGPVVGTLRLPFRSGHSP